MKQQKAKTSKISIDETHIRSVVNATENVHFSCPHAELIKYSFQNLKAIVLPDYVFYSKCKAIEMRLLNVLK